MREQSKVTIICNEISRVVNAAQSSMSSEELYALFSNQQAYVSLYPSGAFRPRFMTILRRLGQDPALAKKECGLVVTADRDSKGVVKQKTVVIHPAEKEKEMTGIVKVLETPSEDVKPLTILRYKDRPVFIAKEVGERLGYAEGALPDLIRREWSEDLLESQDYVTLRGEELAEFKELSNDTVYSTVSPDPMLFKTARLTLLFETGINAITLLSKKPEARKLRRYLIEEVLPQLHRTGAYTPALKVTPQGELVASGKQDVNPISLTDAQTQYNHSLVALQDAEIRMERHKLEMRKQTAEALVEMAELGKSMNRISDAQHFAILHKAAETKAGVKVPVLEGKTPTEVAEHFHVTMAELSKKIIPDIETAEGLLKGTIRKDERYVSAILHDEIDLPNGKKLQPTGYLIKKKLFDLIDRECQVRKIGIYA